MLDINDNGVSFKVVHEALQQYIDNSAEELEIAEDEEPEAPTTLTLRAQVNAAQAIVDHMSAMLARLAE